MINNKKIKKIGVRVLSDFEHGMVVGTENDPGSQRTTENSISEHDLKQRKLTNEVAGESIFTVQL